MTFRFDLYTDNGQYEEGPLRERKEWVEYWREDRKIELIRDVIALANTARMLDKKAFLILGSSDHEMNESGHPKIVGIEPMLTHIKKRNPDYSNAKVLDTLKREFVQAISRNITPPLAGIQLKVDVLDGEHVAYLEIHQLPTEKPFSVKSDFPPRKPDPDLKKGDWWLRFGESKEKVESVPSTEVKEKYGWNYSFTDAFYPLPTQWKQYFESLVNLDDIKNAKDIDPFVNLKTTNGKPLELAVKGFLEDKNSRALTIISDALGGKSSALLREIEQLASYNIRAIQEQEKREEYTPPPTNWIPVFFSLRNISFRDERHFYNVLFSHVNEIAKWWAQKPKRPEKMLGIPGTKWLFYFDGLDEIWSTANKKRFLGILSQFIVSFPQIKVIISSRPWSGASSWHPNYLQTLEISRLDRTALDNYFGNISNLVELEMKEQVFSLLQSELDGNPELVEICSLPGNLFVLADEIFPFVKEPDVSDVAQNVPKIDSQPHLENQTEYSTTNNLIERPRIDAVNELVLDEASENIIPHFLPDDDETIVHPLRIGVVLSNAYQKLWEREEKRHQDSRQSWLEKTEKLAVKMDGRIQEFREEDAIKILRAKGALRWLLGLGIIKLNEERLYHFYQPLTSAIFATRYLKPYWRTQSSKFTKTLDEFSDDFREKVLFLLESMVGTPIILNDDTQKTRR